MMKISINCKCIWLLFYVSSFFTTIKLRCVAHLYYCLIINFSRAIFKILNFLIIPTPTSCLLPLTADFININQIFFKQSIGIVIELKEIRNAAMAGVRSIVMCGTCFVIAPDKYVTQLHTWRFHHFQQYIIPPVWVRN